MRWTACILVVAGILGSALAPTLGQAAPRYGEEEVARFLEVALSESAPESERARAVRELEKTDIRTHLSSLRRLMREERSVDIRLAAAYVLVSLGDRKSPRDLLLATAYEGSRTPSVSRSEVLVGLGRLGDPAAVFHLERAVKGEIPEDEPYFYVEACRAIGMLGTADAVRLLLTSLREGKPAVRSATLAPLAAVARSRSNPFAREAAGSVLLAARKDGDEGVAEQAMSAVLWDGAAPSQFFPLLESDPDPAVRARAARVMNRHLLTPDRRRRLQAAASKEKDPTVRKVIDATLASQAALGAAGSGTSSPSME